MFLSVVVSILLVSVSATKLPALTVAVLSMLGLIAFMLVVCLLSCVYTIHKRNEKSKKLMLLAQQAGKRDGEAFRQVTPDRAILISLRWRNIVGSQS